MTELNNSGEAQMPAYSEAVKSGLYAKRSGLLGKYDNVRKYWEDENTRIFLRPYLQQAIERAQSRMRRLRIVDLGCGSADGYELLSGIRFRDADLHQAQVELLSGDVLGLYKGVDLNQDLLEQARSLYGGDPKLVFQQADFTQGFLPADPDGPYDFFFSSFGTFSHHSDDETAIQLLCDIAEATEEHSFVVCDWLGRYSYEWWNLWTDCPRDLPNMDYVVSYIYDRAEREARRDSLQHLTLRLMSREEAEAIVGEAARRSRVSIEVRQFFDRSVFTGRHMDTGDYNPYAQPLRAAVNCLHESNLRTRLDDLILDYVPKPGFPFLNAYYEHLQMAWNALVKYTIELLNLYDERKRQFRSQPPPVPATYPSILREMMQRMRSIVESVGWLNSGLPRENIIEPQLGYALRYLTGALQQGRGCGHGLVGVLEIDKARPKTAGGRR